VALVVLFLIVGIPVSRLLAEATGWKDPRSWQSGYTSRGVGPEKFLIGAAVALGVAVLIRSSIRDRRARADRARREAGPCALCGVVPNARDHDCRVRVGTGKKWHKTSTYYAERVNPYARSGRRQVRWHAALVGPAGIPILIDPRWMRSEESASLLANVIRRNLQLGYDDPRGARVVRRAIEGSDLSVDPLAPSTVRGTRPAGLTDARWVWLQAHWDFTCAYCGDSCAAPEVEHVIPLARGGADCVTNLAPACKPCNREKGTMTGSEYREWRARRGLRVTPARATPAWS
jgi:hypothetical protein